jgi:hypothetical protein
MKQDSASARYNEECVIKNKDLGLGVITQGSLMPLFSNFDKIDICHQQASL